MGDTRWVISNDLLSKSYTNMASISLVYIYWYISIGMLVGYISRFVFGARGLRTLPSIFIGALGSVSVGLISQIFDLGDNLVLGLIGSIGFLFIFNIFRSHGEEEEIQVENR